MIGKGGENFRKTEKVGNVNDWELNKNKRNNHIIRKQGGMLLRIA